MAIADLLAILLDLRGLSGYQDMPRIRAKEVNNGVLLGFEGLECLMGLSSESEWDSFFGTHKHHTQHKEQRTRL